MMVRGSPVLGVVVIMITPLQSCWAVGRVGCWISLLPSSRWNTLSYGLHVYIWSAVRGSALADDLPEQGAKGGTETKEEELRGGRGDNCVLRRFVTYAPHKIL